MALIRLNPTSKKAQGIINAYESAHMSTLAEAYPSHYSSKKEKAFKYCIDIMEAHNGSDMRITGANTYLFSCACKGYSEAGEKGLIYFTHAHDYFIPYVSMEEFESRWAKVSEDIKARTAKALTGIDITSEAQAIEILEMAEMFTAMQSLVTR